MAKRVLGLLVCSVLAACSPAADTKAAESAISSFHAALNAANVDAIYDGSSADLKEVSTKDNFAKLLKAVHVKLGSFKNGKSIGWNDNVTSGGHFVTIIYRSTYEKGTAAEQFVYRVEGKQVSLAGYHVNSDALILN